MPAFDPYSPEVTYALKGNIAYPGTSAQATAAAATAQSRITDALTQNPAQIGYVTPTVTVPAADIRVAT